MTSNVEAKQGCCSGHSGVNCSAGAQSNGHVICNDGSRTSSCLYSEMVMCGGSIYVAPAPTAKPYIAPVVKISTPKPTVKPTVAPTESPTVTPTSTPEVLSASTEEPEPTTTPIVEVQGATTNNPVGSLVGLGIFLFGGYKSLRWLARKTAPQDTV